MDNLPPDIFYVILALVSGIILFLISMYFLVVEISMSSCILSESMLDYIKTQHSSRRKHLLWTLNHPRPCHCALLFMHATLDVLVSTTLFYALFILTNSQLLLTCLSILGIWVILGFMGLGILHTGLKHTDVVLLKNASLIYRLTHILRFLFPGGREKRITDDGETFSVKDIEQALEMQKTESEGAGDILSSVLHFGEETVAEVMVPRVDVIDINIHDDFKAVMKCVIDNNYSRIPVRDGAQDKIKGVLYVKDLLPHCNKGSDFEWQKLIRKPFFVPETKMIDDLLREFQKNKIHIAIVIDEYGITSGIVTMEDILEEIVGEINDEYDEEEKHYIRLDENVYIFEGKTPLPNFFETLGLNEDDFAERVGDAETLAGFILELMDEFPMRHQRVKCRNLTFEVLTLDQRRISKIKVTIAKDQSTDAKA